MAATPKDAAPSIIRRQELVAQVMDSLEDLEELPVPEQTARLAEAQNLLHGVLNNSADAAQLGIPGVSSER